jgi:high-affinity iron transporter
MLATAIIVFREVLEAALIISIVLAAAKGLPGRNIWVGGGIAAGVIGAVVVASFAGVLAEAAQGMGQELFNATILLAAVFMLGWHNVWMSQHGREMAKNIKDVGRAVVAGDRPLYALAIVCAVAVLREGSETVLFLYGIASSSGEGPMSMMLGGALGLIGGVAFGAALYLGLLSIPMRHLFTVTNWMILLLAAGMASQAAGFLVQADLLPPLVDTAWDTSWLLNEKSVVGKVLHALVGYVSRPAGIQVAFFVATVLIIETFTLLVARNGEPTKKMATR